MNIVIIFGHTRPRSEELTMTAVVCVKEQKREERVQMMKISVESSVE